MLHMEYTKVMEINVRYDTIRYTIYMWHTGRKRFGISSVLSGLSVPFRCMRAWGNVWNEITKNDRLHFVLNISFVFIFSYCYHYFRSSFFFLFLFHFIVISFISIVNSFRYALVKLINVPYALGLCVNFYILV